MAKVVEEAHDASSLMKKQTLACDGLDPHIWRSFWILLMDLDNLVEEVHLEDDDT